MTTETVCVSRNELLELLQDGVDDYWITSESGAQIIEILRSALAQPATSEPVAIVVGSGVQWLPGADKLQHREPLYRHPLAQAVPEYYMLVPIDLTQEMLEAGWAEERDIQENETSAWDFRSCNRLQNIYRAMLAAAPQPTEGSTANSHECKFNLDMEGKCFYCENTEGSTDE